METYDRNNMSYDAIVKRDKKEALAEAREDEYPDLRMGLRQVEARQNQTSEPSNLEIVFTREKEAVIPAVPAAKNCVSLSGYPAGPAPTPKLAKLSDKEYSYYKEMSGPERRAASLGRRTDPSFPRNLRLYMARFPNKEQKKKHQEKIREIHNFYT